MVRSFPNIIKSLLQQLPAKDYPVLHSQLFCQIWLTFILDTVFSLIYGVQQQHLVNQFAKEVGLIKLTVYFLLVNHQTVA